jgi:hypothetical protein
MPPSTSHLASSDVAPVAAPAPAPPPYRKVRRHSNPSSRPPRPEALPAARTSVEPGRLSWPQALGARPGMARPSLQSSVLRWKRWKNFVGNFAAILLPPSLRLRRLPLSRAGACTGAWQPGQGAGGITAMAARPPGAWQPGQGAGGITAMAARSPGAWQPWAGSWWENSHGSAAWQLGQGAGGSTAMAATLPGHGRQGRELVGAQPCQCAHPGRGSQGRELVGARPWQRTDLGRGSQGRELAGGQPWQHAHPGHGGQGRELVGAQPWQRAHPGHGRQVRELV